uniref:GLUCAGON domain-containing protein n=1 Tax=Heterorhabditis bacteriophora TaxID=37862 RepID=A0A1I7WXD9_HETBA
MPLPYVLWLLIVATSLAVRQGIDDLQESAVHSFIRKNRIQERKFKRDSYKPSLFDSEEFYDEVDEKHPDEYANFSSTIIDCLKT